MIPEKQHFVHLLHQVEVSLLQCRNWKFKRRVLNSFGDLIYRVQVIARNSSIQSVDRVLSCLYLFLCSGDFLPRHVDLGDLYPDDLFSFRNLLLRRFLIISIKSNTCNNWHLYTFENRRPLGCFFRKDLRHKEERVQNHLHIRVILFVYRISDE